MPRGPRLDAPGVLHHVMARGIERRNLFRDDRDREDFVRRLAGLVQARACTIYAWVLLPNHVHLLLRTRETPLARTMRSLLAGYAGAFSRRHRRVGHLFQNRYKSIVVEAEPYLLELVRYIHLNPLRAGTVKDLRQLARYPWSGHIALAGRRVVPWQDTHAVLGCFGPTRRRARERYAAFVAEGAAHGRRPELQGGGLIRSPGGWAAVQALRRGRERWAADERILGSSEFVEAIRRDATPPPGPKKRAAARAALPTVIERCAAAWGVTPAELTAGSRRRAVAHARAVVSRLAVHELGLPIAEVAREVGISPTAVRLGIAQGDALLESRDLDVSKLLPSIGRKLR